MSSDSNNTALAPRKTEGTATGNPSSAEHKPPEQPVGLQANANVSASTPSGPATPPAAGAQKVSPAGPVAEANASPAAGVQKPAAPSSRLSAAPAAGRPGGAPSPAQTAHNAGPPRRRRAAVPLPRGRPCPRKTISALL